MSSGEYRFWGCAWLVLLVCAGIWSTQLAVCFTAVMASMRFIAADILDRIPATPHKDENHAG